MQRITKFNDIIINDVKIDISMVDDLQGNANEEMKNDGWTFMVLIDRKCIILKFDNGILSNKGFVLNDEKVLKTFGNGNGYGNSIYCNELIEEGIVDLDYGTRFEGSVLKESGIPFGFGCMYDDDGLLVYKGIMIDWKRFGWGVSYHNNASVEYEGYWCDDKRCGSGKLYDRRGKLVKECEWYNGSECGTEYIGDGSHPIAIGTKHLKLANNCKLKDWNVSWFVNLESIEIGDDCFESVQTFKIEGLKRLKSVKIGNNSFTGMKKSKWHWQQANNQCKSFYLLNCKSLESIDIGDFSFSDFGGRFELKNLSSLKSIKIGCINSIANESCNFYWSSFVIQGKEYYGLLND